MVMFFSYFLKGMIHIGKNRINKRLGIGTVFKEKNVFTSRSLTLLLGFTFCFLLLLIRIGYIQFVKGTEYKANAYNQQTTSQVLASKRGTIYDATNKILAISSTVDTVSINRGQVFYNDGSEVSNETLASGFSEIFSMDYNEVLEKLNSDSSVITIAKKVEKPVIDNLNTWMSDNKISSGINIDDDSKRTYPYNSLASNVIGFYGNDKGLEGIESAWENELSGTPGRIVTSTNVNKQAISDENEQYIPAQNGSDVYLTLDVTVQSIAEEYLNQAVKENRADGGCVIIMKPSTGDILAEASYPTYNLNTPFTPNTTELQSKWDTMSTEEKSAALNNMWRNKPISDLYEPGSTFKLITSAIGLEENVVKTDTEGDFTCNKIYKVGDREISCWSSVAHGKLSLRGALEQSCNPSLIQLGQRIGKERFYKYLQAFGLLDKTGVRMSGESKSIFYDYDDCHEVELATMSFGQRFSITPLQLITAVSATVNGGNLMQPRIVSKVVNTDTGVETELAPVKVRQVISEDTSSKIKSMMRSVVTDGTGKYAAVNGYSVGGKSGTSEPPDDKKEQGYVASFVAISPVENPEVIVLVVLNNPNSDGRGSHQGGTICAPVASQILSKVLPHLGITSTSTTSQNESSTILADVTSKSLTDARKTLEASGFKVLLKTSANSDAIVSSQYPKSGSFLQPGSIICLYTAGSEKTMKEVPDLKGKTAQQAQNTLNSLNLNIAIEGSGKVISQDILAGTQVEEGSIITVNLKDEMVGGAQ